MELAGKRILVIGGAGLIGSHTVEKLLREPVAEIRVFDNFSRGRLENLDAALADERLRVLPAGCDVLHRDLLSDAMQGIDAVLHFAALWLLHCHDYPRSAFEVNVSGTFNVLEACLQSQVERLVFSSSASVYGDAVEEPMSESHPYNNTTFYGATKICGEHLARALYHRYRDTARRFEYVGLRYMNVYGPRQDDRGAYIPVILRMLDRIDAGLPPVVYGDGAQAYDFVDVSDCARANVCALESSACDEFYNVGTGVRTTLRELAETLLELTGSRLPVRYEPAGTTFVKNRVGCTRKAAADLGFRAQVPLREGLARLIAWRRARREAPGAGARPAAGREALCHAA
jgi:UDP-glucose 4-epimerase